MTASIGELVLGFAGSFERGLAAGFADGLSWAKELPRQKTKMEKPMIDFANRIVPDLSTQSDAGPR
jgi:hypothetical protein